MESAQSKKVQYRQKEKLWCLGHRHPISSRRPKLCSKYRDFVFRTVFGWLRPQYDLRWRSTLKELSSSRRGNWFSYMNHLNLSSYAKVTVNMVWIGQRPKYYAWHQTHVDECLMQCVSDSPFKTALNRKTFNTKKFRLVEPIDFHIQFVSIRGRMRPQETNQDQAMFSVGKSEWKAYHLSENLPIEWKLTIRVKTYRSSESLPIE